MGKERTGTKSPLSNLSKLIAKGENARGFTSQTANGTAKAGTNQPGWNRQWDWEKPMAEPTGPWSGNRSGE